MSFFKSNYDIPKCVKVSFPFKRPASDQNNIVSKSASFEKFKFGEKQIYEYKKPPTENNSKNTITNFTLALKKPEKVSFFDKDKKDKMEGKFKIVEKSNKKNQLLIRSSSSNKFKAQIRQDTLENKKESERKEPKELDYLITPHHVSSKVNNRYEVKRRSTPREMQDFDSEPKYAQSKRNKENIPPDQKAYHIILKDKNRREPRALREKNGTENSEPSYLLPSSSFSPSPPSSYPPSSYFNPSPSLLPPSPSSHSPSSYYQVRRSEGSKASIFSAKGGENQNPLKSFITQVEKNQTTSKLEFNPSSPKSPKTQDRISRRILSPSPFNSRQTYYLSKVLRAFDFPNENEEFFKGVREHFGQTHQSCVFGMNMKEVGEKVREEKEVYLMKYNEKFKYTIAFDLDETLIHCNESPENSDIVLPIKFPSGQTIEAGINIRPHAFHVLNELSNIFEIIVFTASHSCYANVVLDFLDPQRKLISHRLYRENCIQLEEGLFIKDLRIIKNRKINEILLVDNAAYSFCSHLENGIPILPFYDSKNDNELLELLSYLKKLLLFDNIVDGNKRCMKLDKVGKTGEVREAVKCLDN